MSLGPVFGVMKFERPPIDFDFLERWIFMALDWLQSAGGFALAGIAFWLLYATIYPVYDLTAAGSRRNRHMSRTMVMFGAVASSLMLIGVILNVMVMGETGGEKTILFLGYQMTRMRAAMEIAYAVGGLAAMIGFGAPFVYDVLRMRKGRIYAIAKLSWKEAIRRRIVWVFLGILILYMFPARWFFQDKPEDEIKTIVYNTSRGLNVLLISVGLLLASFAIPSDIKSLSILTVATKPVERFEIILGRLFGYLGLLTVALIVMTGAGVLLINFGTVSPEAQEESMKARSVAYGDLEFRHRRTGEAVGIDVGREDNRRKYIPGHPQSNHRAVWNFSQIPSSFGKESTQYGVMEFAFDIYRTTKGDEGVGVLVSFEMFTHRWDESLRDEYEKAAEGLKNVRPENAEQWAKVNELARKYGRYAYSNFQIFDYHTSAIPVPTGLFQNAFEKSPTSKSAFQEAGRPPRLLQVQLKCETPSQFVGAAKFDLYLLATVGNFSANYMKGALGLWLRLVIAITLAVTFSTYLSGVLSFLAAWSLYVAGFFLEFIQEVISGKNAGGGPFESLTRLAMNTTTTAELDSTPTVQLVQAFDVGVRWVFKRGFSMIPDVDRYQFSGYVAQGFNLEPSFLLAQMVVTFAYVLPWLVAAYYLMKAREIAA